MAEAGERVYHSEDKTGWGDGPWQDEPDKVQWVDDQTGLDCLIVRNHSGNLCGYVGVQEGHPWFHVGYSQCMAPGCRTMPPEEYEYCGKRGPEHKAPEDLLDVHGGITYSGFCQEYREDSGMTPEDWEGKAICHVPLPGRPAHVWWFGFDTSHAGDYSPAIYAKTGVGQAWRAISDLSDGFSALLGGPAARLPRGYEGDIYRDIDYTMAEVTRLAQQLAAVQ